MIEELRIELDDAAHKVTLLCEQLNNVLGEFIDGLIDVVESGDIDKVAEFIEPMVDVELTVKKNVSSDTGLKALLARIDALENGTKAKAPKKALKKKGTKVKKAQPKEPVLEEQEGLTLDPMDFTINRSPVKKGRTVKASNVNEFENMKVDIQEEDGYDKIDDSTKKRTPRNRDPHQDVNAVCVRCNESYEVHPSLLKASYVCDKCILKKVKR